MAVLSSDGNEQRQPRSKVLQWGTMVLLCVLGGCSEPEADPAISADICGPDAPQFRKLCVVTANQIHFKHAGPARSFTVVRTVNSVGTGTIVRIPKDKESYTYYLDAAEPFAKYSIFFSGTPALDLDFYHGTKLRPLSPKPSGTDTEDALWWISDDGSAATRMTYNEENGIAETYDLQTFVQTQSYQIDTAKLFPYGKHMLLRYSSDRHQVERFFPDANTSVVFVQADAPIHSFWRQGDQIAFQTEDGKVSMPANGKSRVLPLVYIVLADGFGVTAWQPGGANCALTLTRFDWTGGAVALATETGLCDPLYGFSFLGNALMGIVLKGKDSPAVFFGTQDMESTWNFIGTMIYMDESIGVARTTRLDYAYQNGVVVAEQGLLECAAGSQDMNPNARISLFYETGTVLVDDVPEHLSELTTHQNIKSCFGH